MAKRVIFSSQERQIFIAVLANDSDARDYILNKGVIRAIDKGKLYDRLTDVYNAK